MENKTIQIIFEDGCIAETRASKDVIDLLIKNEINVEIINFDRDDGDKELLEKEYKRDLQHFDATILHCNEEWDGEIDS